MKKIMQYADKVFCTILFIATGSMLVIGTMQVFWRFILHNPLTWTEEFLRYLYVWATLLGIGVGIHRKAFTTVTVFSDFVKKRSRLGARMLHVLVIIGQLVFFPGHDLLWLDTVPKGHDAVLSDDAYSHGDRVFRSAGRRSPGGHLQRSAAV